MKTIKTSLVLALSVSMMAFVGCRTTPEKTAAMAVVGTPVAVSGNSAVAEHLRQRDPSARAGRVEAYLSTHAGEPGEVRARLTEGAVFTGMTKEQLMVVLGEPWLISARTGPKNDHEVWMYLADIKGEDQFLFKNEQLKSWKLWPRPGEVKVTVAHNGKKKAQHGAVLAEAK